MQKLGAAREGEKTMVDALAPAVGALQQGGRGGAAAADALAALAEAAQAGAQATISMQALKGRASYLGPRSVGHEDPGAASTALILGALRDVALAGHMTQPSALHRGLPVSEGTPPALLYLADPPAGTLRATAEQVAEAFAAVATDRPRWPAAPRAGGRGDEADIVAVGALIAADPALVDPAVAAVADGADAAAAVAAPAEAQAAVLAALANPELAERADDVRQVGQAVLDHLAGGSAAPPRPASFILVRREVGPADLIELADEGWPVRSRSPAAPARTPRSSPAASASPCSPASIRRCSRRRAGTSHGGRGGRRPDRRPSTPGTGRRRRAPAQPWAAGATAQVAWPGGTALRQPRHAPADRRRQEITLLCNVASAAETRLGLAAGAAGVGLLRTEIPFTGATAWPTEPSTAAPWPRSLACSRQAGGGPAARLLR